MSRIVFTRSDGGVSIVAPAEGADINAIMGSGLPPDAIGAEIVPAEDIPSDRTFRDAWERPTPGQRVNVNLTKAKAIAAARVEAAKSKQAEALGKRLVTTTGEEAQRRADALAIKNRMDGILNAINNAPDVNGLKVALAQLEG